MNTKKSGRRRFLKDGAALAALAVGGVQSASGQALGSEIPQVRPEDIRALGKRSRFVTSVRTLGRWGQLTPLQDSTGIITPSALHFMAAHGYDPPDIDPQQHRLLIHGLVDRPLIFTLAELQSLPSVSRIHFIECNGNNSSTALSMKAETVQQTHGFTSCSEWTGVTLSLLLREAGVQKGASWLVAEGAEGGKHTMSIPLEKAMDDVLVAYGQNGEPVRPEQGYPLRLVVPGWRGVNNVKWLRRIKVVDQPYMTKWESSAYSRLMPDGKARWFLFEMPPKSVITRPSGGQRLPSRGFYEITGLAWSGGGAIRRVEVSTDGGRNWKDAQLQQPVFRMAHTRFRFPWNWDGEEAVLQSRCTDERGDNQQTLAELGGIQGLKSAYWRPTSPRFNRLNLIFPWKVTREGRVHNALF